MAFPDAAIVELDAGLNLRSYDDVLAVELWRRFMSAPASFLHRLFED